MGIGFFSEASGMNRSMDDVQRKKLGSVRLESKVASKWLFFLLVLSSSAAGAIAGGYYTPKTRFYDFKIQPRNVTRLCKTKTIVSVNGQYPGPTLYANEGDRVVIKVTNEAQYDITIHWHGIRQIRSGWADGPAYITQCPIQTGKSYVYNFTITIQSGTLFWHAHETWLRGTVYGAIVIYPQKNYPFITPYEEKQILLGEWWVSNVEDVEVTALQSGGRVAIADAYTINGCPGPLYNCTSPETYVLKLKREKTYLLRIVNAALNTELFFSVANHNLTVVEADGDYTKPYITDTIVLTPGQTTNVLINTSQPIGRYYMGVSPYTSTQFPVNQLTPALAILEYEGAKSNSTPPTMPTFPARNDTNYVTQFSNSLRCLNNHHAYLENVPQTVDTSLFFTVGLGAKPCDANSTCAGPGGLNITASFNNVSLILPKIALLQAYYYNISGVFTTDFPENPPFPFNYTGNPPSNPTPENGTKVTVIPYNSNVQLVLQDTSILGTENHPIHLHGYSFYIVGQGFGNFNASTANFNLVDPPRRNTVGVPVGGWAALRFTADNPGVWFMHCHLEIHTTWGLATALLVQNGEGPDQSLPPPPADLPVC